MAASVASRATCRKAGSRASTRSSPVRGIRRPHPRPHGSQPHLHRPHPQHRHDLDRRRAQLGLHRPHPALDGRAARSAQGHAVSRLRRARLRGSGRHQRRQLRPLLRAHARDGRIGAHDPPARGHAARRSRSTSTTGAASSPTSSSSTPRSSRSSITSSSIMDGPAGSRRRGLRGARGAQRRARLLPRQQRRRNALQGARALAELRPHGRRCSACSRATNSPTSFRPSARST